MSRMAIARALNLAPDQRPDLRAALRELIAGGMVTEGKNGLLRLRSGNRGALTGILRFRNGGGAHFTPDRNQPENRTALLALGLDPDRTDRIFVPPFDTGVALPGDRVAITAAVIENSDRTPVVGRVVEILERSRRPFVGTLARKGRSLALVPDDPAMPGPFDIRIPEGSPAKPGHAVLAVPDSWESQSQRPLARVIETIGPADTPGLAMLTIIHKFGLPTDFSAAALNEAASWPASIPPEEIKSREDWRDREVITIDPTDARDFDDAIAVTPLPGGGWELAVHIADVSYYVRPGTAVDREAESRGNSVYLADRVLPMLPESLSNGLCSLQPGVDRLTRVAVLSFDARGRRTKARFARAVIHSRRRFTYEEAFQEMKASDPKLRSPVLDRAWPLASLLRRRRFEAGSLDLDFPEVRAVLDPHGRPVGLRTTHNDESHQLIEEFMLAANEAVARFLRDSQVPAVYRVHEDPDEEKLSEFAAQLAAAGIAAGDLTRRAELQRLLTVLKGRADGHALKIALLKSLKRAVYMAEPRGHYGLAKSNYTHFTSPIRRYADLIVHRALGGLLAKQGHPAERIERLPGQSRMAEIAEHLSTTERTAAEAEQESQRLMQTEYFASLLKLTPTPTFPAAVVEARRLGVFVELAEFPIRGLVRPEDFPDGDFRFDPAAARFASRRPRGQLQPGTPVTVSPCRVDRDRRLIDFRITSLGTAHRPAAGPGRRQRTSPGNQGHPPRRETRRAQRRNRKSH
jgi:ribonuclease R